MSGNSNDEAEVLEWIPLYWMRFLIGTKDMKADEIGAYLLLLIHEWKHGFLPNSDKDLKKISRISAKKLQNVLKKFEKIENKYFNNTLEIIRIEQQEKSAKYSNRGFNGAKARWDKHKTSIAQALLKHDPSNANDIAYKNKIENKIESESTSIDFKKQFSESFSQIESIQRILSGLKQPFGEKDVLGLLEIFDPEFHAVYKNENFKKYCFRFVDFVKDENRMKKTKKSSEPSCYKPYNASK